MATETSLVKQPAVQKSKTDPKVRAANESTSPENNLEWQGIDGDHLNDAVPYFIEAPNENVYKGRHNTWIVLGRDRPGPKDTGYGALGDTHAGAIDIVVGRMGMDAASNFPDGAKLYCDNNMMDDAARIYLSQKADIDSKEYLDLATGRVGKSVAKSAIALKADGIRIVGREGIKLVTGGTKKNSRNGPMMSVVGVDIIAGNVDKHPNDLQPMVKGDNLAEALERLSAHLNKLNGVVDSFLEIQLKYNTALMHHWHHSPYFTAPTSPSTDVQLAGNECLVDSFTEVKESLLRCKGMVGAWRVRFLKKQGKKYINSEFNNVN